MSLSYILPRSHPLWPHQQAFLEVSLRTAETNSKRLLEFALADYQAVFGTLPDEALKVLFQEWSVICARITQGILEREKE